MNIKRIGILAIAAIAAGAAAMLVRSTLSTPTVAANQPAVPMAEILVAAQDVSAGRVLDPTSVRWQIWPEKAIMPNYISRKAQPDLAKAISGAVVRAPLTAGQPILEASLVRAGATGFMAATVTPGMRAIGVQVNAETSAGGFILPNDRVDVVLTRDLSGGGGSTKNFQSVTILSDVRVLAVDQTAHQGKDQESVVGKTATLELTEEQAELVARAQQTGVLSLTLRSIGDSSGMPTAKDFTPPPRPAGGGGRSRAVEQAPLVVYRYGVRRENGSSSSPPAAPASGEGESAPQPSTQQPTQGAVALETP